MTGSSRGGGGRIHGGLRDAEYGSGQRQAGGDRGGSPIAGPRRAERALYPIGAITRGRGGVELAEYGDMKDAGAVAVSDDGSWVTRGDVMSTALTYARTDSIFRSRPTPRIGPSPGGAR